MKSSPNIPLKRTPLLLACLICLTSCGPQSGDPAKGFRLPEGDPEAGKIAFVDSLCTTCHTVDGVTDIPQPAAHSPIKLRLGGDSTRIKSYDMLLTSIIHPNHGIAHPRRPEYTDSMGNSVMPDMTYSLTIREMIDLVAFLQEKYPIVIPEPPAYHQETDS